MLESFPADAFLLQFSVFGVPVEETTDDDETADAQAITLYVVACGYRDLKQAVDAAQLQMADLLYHPLHGLQASYRHVSGPEPKWFRVNASWPRSGLPITWLSQLSNTSAKLSHVLLLTSLPSRQVHWYPAELAEQPDYSETDEVARHLREEEVRA